MRTITYKDAIQEALREELKRDERVFLLGEDIGIYGGAFGVTYGMFDEFGEERIKDTPISEAAIAGTALGAALTGMRPVAEIMFIDFATVAMDQIVNQIAKIRYMFGGKAKVPLVIRTPGGAGRRAAAQHSQSLEAWFAHVPGLKVAVPGTAYDVKGMLKAAIRDDNPVIFVEHKMLYGVKGEVPEEEYTVPLGKADIKREGTDVSIIAYSYQVYQALEAADALAKDGISAEVVDVRSLKPLDTETIVNSVKKTGRAVITHQAVQSYGAGAEIAAQIVDSEAFDYLDAPIKRVAGLDVPIPYSPPLEDAAIPSVDQIVKAVKELF